MKYSSKKHCYSFWKPICQLLDKYLAFNNKYLVKANRLQYRPIDSDRVGETTSMLANRLVGEPKSS